MADKTVTYRLAADISGFQARMAQASASVKKFANDATSATKEGGKFRSGLDDLGRGAGRVGLVAAAGLAAAVAVAANFDQAMSNVQAATHESAENMDLLRDAAIQAGRDTVFSASEAANGIEQLAKAGVSTADILGGGLQGALDLAAAGSISVGEAAETAATAMTQFGASGSDVPHIADLLAAAAGKAQGEVSDMGMALKQSGLVASQMGLSIEETTGTLAAFASAGLLGSDAGTSFKSMLLRLANPSNEAAKTMERLGISAYDARGNFVGIEALSTQLKGAFEGQSQAQRDAALATIFGSDAIRAANVLYNEGGKGIERWTNNVDDAGYAAETAATRLDNLKGDLEQLRGSLETALIGTGEGSQGALRGLVQGVTDVVNAYNKLPDAAQGATAALLGITAVTGGGIWFGAKVVGGIADARKALSDLGVQASTTKGLLSGIGKGIQFVAIIEGLNLVSQTIDKVFDERIDDTQLGRSLTALARGEVTGELADKLGSDLGDIGKDVDLAGSKLAKFNSLLTSPFSPDSGYERARAEIEQIDQALASLVESGSVGKAKRAFAEIADAAVSQGSSMDDVVDRFDDYRLALDNARGSTDAITSLVGGGLAGAFQSAIPPIKATGNAMGDAAGKGQRLKDVLAEIQGFLDQRAALRNYRAAFDDFTSTIKRNGNVWRQNTAKGRENQAQLDNIASSALQVADHLKGVNRVRFMRQAVGEIQQVAKQLGVPRAVTQQLIDKLKEAGRQHPKPKVEVNAGPALAGVAAVQRALGSLHDKWVTVYTNHVSTGDAGRGGHPVDAATGGYIRGPGTSTSDSIPARLSDGEYVVRAAAVQRYGTEFLHAVNAMRFAQGGPVGRPTVNVTPNVTATASLNEAAMARFGQVVAPYVAAAIVQASKGHAQAALAGRRT